jgi:hypothetical protein
MEGRWRRGLPDGEATYTTREGHRISGIWNRPRYGQ